MQVIEQLGLLAGEGRRVVVTDLRKERKVESAKVVVQKGYDEAWDKWAQEVCERVFRVPAEGIEPPMMPVNSCACYV